jgi:Haem-binding uptake, Tiki superfamily, ChaN
MATATNLRSRRSEAQWHALAGVEREIRATDPSSRRKYLRDFSAAFRSYQSVVHSEELKTLISAPDLVLIGDYHALPACQRFAATLLEQTVQLADRPLVLGVETIFARDQHILDEWWRREIDEAEFRQRIRFDLDWGYDWDPFYELLVTARDHAEAIYGLDCMPREDLRKIGARDRHAAHKLAEIRQKHPNAVIMVLFGESHLAPGHLPRLLAEHLPQQRTLTILQNVDALYWLAAGEQHQQVEAVRVSEDTVCVFNSTPLEKYENYRLHLSRWGRTEEEGPDLAPTLYNLIDSLARFLGINRYSAHNTAQPKFLVDLLPEAFSNLPESQLRRLLERETASVGEQPSALDRTNLPAQAGLLKQASLLKKLEERGCLYLPRVNAFYIREFHMMYAAEEAARFLHNACRGLPPERDRNSPPPGHADRFYTQTLEHALSYFGSRVLYPARPAPDLDAALTIALCEEHAQSAQRGNASAFDEITRNLGYALGAGLYNQYLLGRVSRSRLRHLFLAHLEEPGSPRQLCAEFLASHRSSRKGPYSDHSPRARSRRA